MTNNQTGNNISYINYDTTDTVFISNIDSTILPTSLSNIENTNIVVSYKSII